ncbi:CBS domain-containing protein [Microlunatus soli]|uniref:CBS domain-containing protein n=1 Tax=Microlunatus soli TaxID=630515 RepID=A0A1H2AAP1_9ACTN|nr:CBS domain-containing protein [Microlunatus soli]SDT43028.1 CBS domain-containing protein [Microlunatus soli]
MRISDILHDKGADVVTATPDQTVGQLVAILKQHNLGAVVVSAGGRDIAGIVSERDVVRRLADGPAVLDQRIDAIMTPVTRLRSCGPTDSVDSLMELMTENRIRHVPVLDDDGRLTGIVSIGDVVKSRLGELKFQRDELEHYVSG